MTPNRDTGSRAEPTVLRSEFDSLERQYQDRDRRLLEAIRERDNARAALADLWEAVEAGGFDVQLNYREAGRS